MKKLLSILFAMVMVFAIPITSTAYSEDAISANYAPGYTERFANYNYLENLAYDKAEGSNFDSVIVVNTNSLDSDGLSASGLIGASNGVICCISNNDSGTRLRKLLNGDTSKTIYFIGGNQVIPESFKSEFEYDGYNCVTLAGRTRIETSYQVAAEIQNLKGNVSSIALTSGYKGVADSVSIAYVARINDMPVILTNGKNIPFDTNGTRTYVLGGNKVMSENIVNQTNAVRLSGENRYVTNRKILEYFGYNKGKYSLCHGDSEYDNMKVAVLTGCCWGTNPVVLVTEFSDKTVLKGATYVKFYTHSPNSPTGSLRVGCYNARYGNDVFKAMNSIYRNTKRSRYKDLFIYTNGDSYSHYYSKNPDYFKRNYYDFRWIDTYEYEPADFDVLVRKSDHKIFKWYIGLNKEILFK